MNCEVKHLAKNIRYRILIINNESYILDMERSFWKIIFPFFFWLSPSPVFKVEDKDIVEKLKESKKKKTDGGLLISLGGFAYVIGILLTPLMGYFEISTSLFINTVLLILALIPVALLYVFISRNREKKLNEIVKLKELQKNVLWIYPRSIKHIFKVLLVHIWFLGIVLFSFVVYIQSGNMMALIISSGLLFALLLTSRITVEEGYTTVKFKRGYDLS